MKTKLIFIIFIFLTLTALAENKEIIGSGIVQINYDKNYTINDSPLIYLDNNLISYPLFEIIGSGYKSTFIIKQTPNKEIIGSGIVDVIKLETNLKGPITSLNPLSVLQQPILTTSDTKSPDLSGLNIGDELSGSGYLSNNNSLQASKIITESNLSQWKVRGYVSHNNNNSFQIGSLLINHASEQIINCNSGVNNQSYVEVKMTADNNYTVGNAINTIQSIECLSTNQLDSNVITQTPTLLQGFISSTQGQDFTLNEVIVHTNNATIYENGERRFLDSMVNIEVSGLLDPKTSKLTAEKIRFLEHRIGIEFPLNTDDINLNQSITLNGVEYKITPQTKDSSNILSNGIMSAIQIGISGFTDSNGNAYISKIINKGIVDYNNITLRGEITNLNNPTFELLNFTINANNALIINLGNGVIDTTTFFNLVHSGSQVEIKNGEYDANLNQVNNALITIKQVNSSKNSNNFNKEIIGSGIIGLYGTATITESTERIFNSSFE